MIKIDKLDVYGWEVAIRGMRNPKQSWDKIDSEFYPVLNIGANDYNLMTKLIQAGTDHRKFMRMIMVSFDITAPLYWWKEFDTYKIGTVANSTSTMHTLMDKQLELSDFSCENLTDYSAQIFIGLVDYLNWCIKYYTKTGDKKYCGEVIQLLPESFNQTRTVMLNYETLRNMYHARKNHKLLEWRAFCDWIKVNLPYSDFITRSDFNKMEDCNGN